MFWGLDRTTAAPTLIGALFIAVTSFAAVAADYQWNLPHWLPPPVVPIDSPMNTEKLELGRHLFYDTRLSINGKFSCGSCHQQARAFSDGRPVAVGATGERHPRNTPGLANVGYLARLTWAHPQLRLLEDQLLVPLFGATPIELGMAGQEKAILETLRGDTGYQERFSVAFGVVDKTAISVANIAKAIAAFERAMISANSPFDRFRRDGDSAAISPGAKRGATLFFSEPFACFQCHGGPHFTDTHRQTGLPFEDFAFHNTGLYNLGRSGRYPSPNTGLHAATGRAGDMGRFKTPSLRNVAVTAPYMHDGSVATLGDVLNIYAAGGRNIAGGPLAGDGRKNPHKSSFVTGFPMSALQRADLIAFLESLTDEAFLSDPRFADPFNPVDVKN
jgi:cytochrome c peroxidase